MDPYAIANAVVRKSISATAKSNDIFNELPGTAAPPSLREWEQLIRYVLMRKNLLRQINDDMVSIQFFLI